MHRDNLHQDEQRCILQSSVGGFRNFRVTIASMGEPSLAIWRELTRFLPSFIVERQDRAHHPRRGRSP
ncbi:hypothetical protein PC128_g21874 [Phytophthora cactorum]|nr:hypothetical protein PC121_g11712 [Phytophthora cactorum]KAG3156439.1 hypothetical protein PC128_g21874 [Phytophthora cactorum]